MQFNSAPAKFNIPFADAGDKVAIPQASQIGVKDGAASLTDGFPPLTRTRIDQGGIPPNGKEMNGILNGITLATRWNQAGGGNVYDSAFSTAIGGYPKGARVLSSDGTKYWRARSDAITSDPEASNSATAGWIPDTITGYLTVPITGDTVLTPVQYSNSHLLFTGSTGSTAVITFPALAGVMWFVENQTNDEILAKTPTGQGVNISAGGRIDIYCDGPNLKSSVVTALEDPTFSNATSRPVSSGWAAGKFYPKSGGLISGSAQVRDMLTIGTETGSYIPKVDGGASFNSFRIGKNTFFNEASATSSHYTKNCYYDGTNWRYCDAGKGTFFLMNKDNVQVVVFPDGAAGSTVPLSAGKNVLGIEQDKLICQASYNSFGQTPASWSGGAESTVRIVKETTETGTNGAALFVGNAMPGTTGGDKTSIGFGTALHSIIFRAVQGDFECRNFDDSGFVRISASAFPVNSDEKLKENLQPLQGALEQVRKARTVSGEFIGNDKRKHIMFFIAQDWADYAPDAVQRNADGDLQLEYDQTIPVVAAAVKELAAENEELRARLAAIEAKLS